MEVKNDIVFLRRLAWTVVFVILLVTLAIVFVPVWIIQPFKPQFQRSLDLSLLFRNWSPLVTLIGLATALILTMWLWRGRRWWRKALLVVMVLLLAVSTWFARQLHFEWMFKPYISPAYAKASEAPFVADTDMVLAVEHNGDAAAYPVRLMAYHHIVHDKVGGTPIVATY